MKNIKSFKNPIYVTRPLLPSLEKVYEKIKEIWESQWLTNMGVQHKDLELKLINYLKVKYLTLFNNGTLALQLAFQALNLTGEVITTPFTFPATTTSLFQCNLKPIYCDIRVDDFNINSENIEDLINPDTSAILPVHVFGNPCEIEKIEKIAKNYNLKVIYDAAHCFGVEYKDVGIGNYGDISMFSFHATKTFHTIEGGALTYNNPELKEILYLLKNFGIKSEEEVILPGTNAKMNELQAAIGLLNLELVDQEIEKRKKLSFIYREELDDVQGIRYLNDKKDVKHNYQYFPIIINEKEFKRNRNFVYETLKKYNIFTRKYFYPLTTSYKFCENEEDCQIPNAELIAEQVLCLPLYGDLKREDVEIVCKIIKKINS
ncbi:MAG: DegT/DnrJ/EryC1/StrS family aminotransferase [Promethearchaeota archaeon]